MGQKRRFERKEKLLFYRKNSSVKSVFLKKVSIGDLKKTKEDIKETISDGYLKENQFLKEQSKKRVWVPFFREWHEVRSRF